MCLMILTLFFGPRFAIILWYLIEPGRWDNAFDTLIWPVLGFIFLPWTTLMFVAVVPRGRVDDTDWVLLALAFILDLFNGTLGFMRRRLT